MILPVEIPADGFKGSIVTCADLASGMVMIKLFFTKGPTLVRSFTKSDAKAFTQYLRFNTRFYIEDWCLKFTEGTRDQLIVDIENAVKVLGDVA